MNAIKSGGTQYMKPQSLSGYKQPTCLLVRPLDTSEIINDD